MIVHWRHQAQFAGYYVAKEKGIYRKHGLDMVILKGGPDCSPVTYLRDGLADFAVLWLTMAMRHQEEGKRLVHLGQVVPRSSMMLVAKKSRHIRHPSDMNGKKVGVWPGDLGIPPRAFFKAYDIEVKAVPQAYTVNLFLRGGVDVASVMWYNEYHTILNTGVDPEELDVFSLYDYGLNFPEDGLYMLETAYRENPGLAAAFARASFEGWRRAFAHPEEALDIVLRYMRDAKIPANRVHQKWMLYRMKDLISPVVEREAVPRVKPSEFATVADFLFNAGMVEEPPDYGRFMGDADAGR